MCIFCRARGREVVETSQALSAALSGVTKLSARACFFCSDLLSPLGGVVLQFSEFCPMGTRTQASVQEQGPIAWWHRELTNGVLQHVCRERLVIGFSRNSPRNECWLVKTLFFLRRIPPVLPPSQVISAKNSVKCTYGACSPLEVVINPEKNPGHFVHTLTDTHAEQSFAREALSETYHWSDTSQIEFVFSLVQMGQDSKICNTNARVNLHKTAEILLKRALETVVSGREN